MTKPRPQPLAAKAGERVSLRAINRVSKLTRGRTSLGHTVEPKSPEPGGQWICIDCGELPQNNMSAWQHADAHPKHRLAWLIAGRIEEP